MENPSRRVFRYHEETKHHFRRYARSAGGLDWRNQPDPFRVYAGASRFDLPLLREDPPFGHISLYDRSKTPVQPADAPALGAFFELSMGLSAWKTAGPVRWSLRMNPSSGNLHPTEAHVVWPGSAALPAGVYHYHPFYHALEQRMALPEALAAELGAALGRGAFLVGVSSIFWRESWKYGERAFRYCLLDTGHALAALSFSAALQGWRMTAMNGLTDAAAATLLGLDRTAWPELAEEHPEFLCAVHPADAGAPRGLPAAIIAAFSEVPITGAPNPLSGRPVNWEIIYEAAEATQKTRSDEVEAGSLPERPFIAAPPSPFSAAAVIRKRRSATAYHAGKDIDREVFFGILDKTLPRRTCAPFDPGVGGPSVDLLLFVHQVKGLEPGLYFLLRAAESPAQLAALTDPGLLWTTEDTRIPLFLLKRGDVRDTAAKVSCHQDIAGDGVFSLAMIAEFRKAVAADPHRYRRLFWECGMIGQVLYLEAEAAGIRGTGIGCYFDDAVHELLGLAGDGRQSLYHFTVGVPVEDRRLGTLPPYGHLAAARSG